MLHVKRAAICPVLRITWQAFNLLRVVKISNDARIIEALQQDVASIFATIGKNNEIGEADQLVIGNPFQQKWPFVFCGYNDGAVLCHFFASFGICANCSRARLCCSLRAAKLLIASAFCAARRAALSMFRSMVARVTSSSL